MSEKKKVLFKKVDYQDGNPVWQVSVENKIVIEELYDCDTDTSNNQLEPLWEFLGISVDFEL